MILTQISKLKIILIRKDKIILKVKNKKKI